MSSSALAVSKHAHGLFAAGLLLLVVSALDACYWTDLGYLQKGSTTSDATVDTTQREPTDGNGGGTGGQGFVDGRPSGGAGGGASGGRGGSADAADTLLVDAPVDANLAPTVRILVPASGSYVSAATASAVTVSGTCSANGQPVDVSGATTASVTCKSGGWSTTVDLTAAPEGTITLYADHSDGVGNQASRATVSFIMDLTAPVPSGVLTFTDIKPTSLVVNWPEANDNFTPRNKLQYRLVRAPSGTLIDTVSSAKANGTVVVDWSVATIAASVGGLTADTLYNYNVLVRDGAGNESVYGAASQKTPADLNAYVAFYPFGGNANDGSGYGNDLTSAGQPTLTTNRNAVASSAYSFDGTSATLSKVKPSGYSITTELSASVWIYRTASRDQKVVGQFNDTCTQGWVLGVNESDNLDVEVVTSADYRTTVGSVPANAWIHLAVTWKAGGTLKGYVNGLKVSESPVTATTAMNIYGSGTTNYFKVGVEPWGLNSLFFSGRIDDIRVYAKELSAADINALYTLPAD
jgi:hypothetical protein